MASLTFSAHGFRWRVQSVRDEAIPSPKFASSTRVTGLYFESDNADPRFLSLNAELLPSESQLEALPMEELARLVSWARSLR